MGDARPTPAGFPGVPKCVDDGRYPGEPFLDGLLPAHSIQGGPASGSSIFRAEHTLVHRVKGGSPAVNGRLAQMALGGVMNKETMLAYVPMLRDMPEQDRPRERLIHVGAQALSTTELLAITLRTGVGGENVVRLAERLLSSFGNLPGLARASLAELMNVKGIGPVKAVEIKAALEIGRRLLAAAPEERPSVTSPADAANLLMSEMMFLEQENLRLILLDTRNKVLKTPTIYVGSLNTSVIRVGELFRAAIRENAAALIVSHNHPSGDPAPSPEDVNVTRQIVKAGKLLDMDVLDHIIIGHQRFVSLRERGLGFD
jgi:DNA repair protein RadC